MAARPTIKFASGPDPKGRILLVPVIHEPFIRLMDSLYPVLVHGSTERKGEGYSAFKYHGDIPEFIGSFTGLCLASVRKNPWFDDDNQWFLRALLAGMQAKGHPDDHRSRCAAANYGTLRLWEKLGLGAKQSARGDYTSASADDATRAALTTATQAAKPGYADIRAYAEKKMAELPPAHIEGLLPPVSLAFHSRAIRVSCNLIP